MDKVYPWVDGKLMDGITDSQVRIQGTWIKIEFVRSYLRPMSSMTQEEKQEYQRITERWMYDSSYSIGDSFDWLNVHHFDYRGLIEKGLTIEAPEGMYCTKHNFD